MGTEPIYSGHAPAITRHQTGKSVLGHRSAQVVADGLLVFEKLGGDDRANSVASAVLRTGRATTITEEPRDRISSTRLQHSTKDVAINHGPKYRR
jgi:hypothetical protein